MSKIDEAREVVTQLAGYSGTPADVALFDEAVREVKAQAWDEGRKAQPVYDPKARYTTWPDNPYREVPSE